MATDLNQDTFPMNLNKIKSIEPHDAINDV